MSDVFFVQPERVFSSGEALGESGEDFVGFANSRVDEIEQARVCGWVGESALMLDRLEQVWREHHSGLHREFQGHRDNFQSFARGTVAESEGEAHHLRAAFGETVNTATTPGVGSAGATAASDAGPATSDSSGGGAVVNW